MTNTTTALWRQIVAGTWRFTLVSIFGFAPWVVVDGWFHRHINEVLLYSLCLLAFLVAALVLLPGLLRGAHPRRRVALFFIPAFTVYALVWCTCWFALGGRTGEWTGIVLGGSAFALVTALVLGWPRRAVISLLLFISAQALGYFAGGQAMTLIAEGRHPGMAGMLAWGVGYGVGFGAGLGWLVHACTTARPTTPVS
jgi:hypothetical protein